MHIIHFVIFFCMMRCGEIKLSFLLSSVCSWKKGKVISRIILIANNYSLNKKNIKIILNNYWKAICIFLFLIWDKILFTAKMIFGITFLWSVSFQICILEWLFHFCFPISLSLLSLQIVYILINDIHPLQKFYKFQI